MTTRVQRTFHFCDDHVRVHADEWQIMDTSGANIEVLFQRDSMLPQEVQEYEIGEGNQLEPSGDSTPAHRILTEILCTVRLRPDQAFELAEDLLRHVQQMAPGAGTEGGDNGAD